MQVKAHAALGIARSLKENGGGREDDVDFAVVPFVVLF